VGEALDERFRKQLQQWSCFCYDYGMNWLKQNWFKLSLFVLAVVAVALWEVIQWKYYELERYQTEQSAMNWAWTEQHAQALVGTKEGKEFKQDFWGLFAH